MKNDFTQRRKQKILELLKKKYHERGCDFYFKSKHLARIIDLDIRVIGKTVKLLVSDDLVEVWNGDTSQHVRTYKTNFGKAIGE